MNSNSNLRKDISSIDVESNWKNKGDFIYLEREHEDKELWIRSIWEWNHQNNYVKHLPDRRIIPFYAKDVQKIELKALEEIERIRNKDKMWN